MVAPEKLALHLAHSAKRAEALGEFQAEAIEQSGLGLIRTHNTPDLQCPAVASGKSHVGAVDPGELLHECGNTASESRSLGPAFQRLSKEFPIKMSIDLSGRYTLMPQHFLHSSQVCTSFYQMSGK